jgi:hypothetical protein
MHVTVPAPSVPMFTVEELARGSDEDAFDYRAFALPAQLSRGDSNFEAASGLRNPVDGLTGRFSYRKLFSRWLPGNPTRAEPSASGRFVWSGPPIKRDQLRGKHSLVAKSGRGSFC